MSPARVHGCPHIERLALSKSLKSGNFALAKAVIRWMAAKCASLNPQTPIIWGISVGRNTIMNRRIFTLALSLGVATLLGRGVALAEDHLAEAIKNTAGDRAHLRSLRP